MSKTLPSGNKFLGLAGKVLPPLAGIMAFGTMPLKWYNNGGLDQVKVEALNRLSQWSFPDPGAFVSEIMNNSAYSGNIIGGLISSVGISLAQKYLGEHIPTTINQGLNIIKRSGASAFAGGLAAAFLWLPSSLNGYPANTLLTRDIGNIISYGY